VVSGYVGDPGLPLFPQAPNDLPAGSMAQGEEERIQRRLGIFTHLDEYISSSRGDQPQAVPGRGDAATGPPLPAQSRAQVCANGTPLAASSASRPAIGSHAQSAATERFSAPPQVGTDIASQLVGHLRGGCPKTADLQEDPTVCNAELGTDRRRQDHKEGLQYLPTPDCPGDGSLSISGRQTATRGSLRGGSSKPGTESIPQNGRAPGGSVDLVLQP